MSIGGAPQERVGESVRTRRRSCSPRSELKHIRKAELQEQQAAQSEAARLAQRAAQRGASAVVSWQIQDTCRQLDELPSHFGLQSCRLVDVPKEVLSDALVKMPNSLLELEL